MQNINEVVRKIAEQHQQMQAKLESDERKRTADAQIEAIIKVLAVSYDKAATYTNLIMIGGYAAVFTIWANTKSYLNPTLAILAAIFMAISALIFVFWEVYKMMNNSTSLNEIAAKLAKDKYGFVANLDQFQKEQDVIRIRQIKVWNVILFLTIIPAVIGAAILFISFFNALLNS